MATVSRSQERSEPTFVFKGTVRKLRSATIPGIKVDDRTAVVLVDQVIESPRTMAKLGGTEITVQVATPGRLKTGQQLVFHAHGWIFGDSVAVQSVKQEAVTARHAPLLMRGGDPVEHRRNRQVETRFESADLVVSGEVTAVRLATEARSRATRGMQAEEPTAAGPVSEHDPHWREAVIEVHAVHKGSHNQNEVVIRFPASMDVRWYTAPKFQPGQQGYFMLHKTPVTTRRAKATRGVGLAARPVVEEVHTALHTADFQPYNAPEGVKRLITLKTGPIDE